MCFTPINMYHREKISLIKLQETYGDSQNLGSAIRNLNKYELFELCVI